MKYLGVYSINDKNGIVDDYIFDSIKKIKKVSKDIVIIANKLQDLYYKKLSALTNKIYITNISGYVNQYIYGLREYKDLFQFDGIIFLNDELFGPFNEMNFMLEEYEKSKNNIVCISCQPAVREYNGDLTEKYYELGYSIWPVNYVKKLSNECIVPNEIDNLNSLVEVTKFVDENEMNIQVVIDTSKVDSEDPDLNFEHNTYYEYEMIVKNKCDVVNVNTFSNIEGIKKGFRENARKIYDYLKEKNIYDVNLIWNHILRVNNIADIKDAMHLNYILPYNFSNKKIINKKIAVFAHLFYEDMYEEVIDYICNIPEYIDIYITTSSKENGEKIEKFLKDNNVKNNYKILEAGKRGRDAGALLVTCRKYLNKYEYICFVHDKKTTGGTGPASVGKSFMYHIWQNLLKSPAYIENIINLFEENERLGLLTPPNPAMAGYVTELVGNEWTCCYEETMKLAEKLKINVPISEDKQPFALSTTFWCRTRAMKPLFDYNWSFEDFPCEPLKLDGTINHAIERILIYVAQNEGYYSAIVQNQDFASLYMNNIYYILSNLLGDLKEAMITESPFEVKNFVDNMIEIYKFCIGKEDIYIYGAGANGKKVSMLLDKWDINYKGFIVTNIENNPSSFCNHKVFSFDKVCKFKNIKIIVGLGVKYSKEVVPLIEDKKIKYICTWYK